MLNEAETTVAGSQNVYSDCVTSTIHPAADIPLPRTTSSENTCQQLRAKKRALPLKHERMVRIPLGVPPISSLNGGEQE